MDRGIQTSRLKWSKARGQAETRGLEADEEGAIADLRPEDNQARATRKGKLQ
jgi:hypothetical protein